MPTYEYVCTSCQNQWEEIQKISEAPIEVCPKCSQQTARRQISGGNFILKGGGWYADLYSSTGASKKGSGDASSSASASSSTPKSESSSGSGGGSGGSSGTSGGSSGTSGGSSGGAASSTTKPST